MHHRDRQQIAFFNPHYVPPEYQSVTKGGLFLEYPRKHKYTFWQWLLLPIGKQLDYLAQVFLQWRGLLSTRVESVKTREAFTDYRKVEVNTREAINTLREHITSVYETTGDRVITLLVGKDVMQKLTREIMSEPWSLWLTPSMYSETPAERIQFVLNVKVVFVPWIEGVVALNEKVLKEINGNVTNR